MKSRTDVNVYICCRGDCLNIKDIAKIAGVSTATVSRVINNSGSVKPETKDRIREVIEQLNFTPNAIARNLCTQDNSNIGVIVPDVGNEFFAEIISGISDVAKKNNYNILFFNTDESEEIEHANLIEVSRERLKGVIIAPVSSYDRKTCEVLNSMEEKGIPVVLIDRNMEGMDCDAVFVNNFEGSYDGVSSLIKEGHKKIAIIAGPITSLPGRERLEGYRKALQDAGITVREEYEVTGDFKFEKAYKKTEELLKLEDKPTAIFTCNNKTTLGCLSYMTHNHIELGKDLAVIGFDRISTLDAIGYPISTVERDAVEQGRKAMELLHDKIDRVKNGETQRSEKIVINIPYKVVLRGSEKYAP